MSQTTYGEFEPKTQRDRLVINVLYALHALALLSHGGSTAIAVILNYILRKKEPDALYVAHHNYMVSSFWWMLLWLLLWTPLAGVAYLSAFSHNNTEFMWLASPALVGIVSIVGWYLYRSIRGWVLFRQNRPPHTTQNSE